jgi:hypothetical protein
MYLSKTRTDQRARPMVLARLRQEAEKRKRYISQIPWWRRPLVGYALSFPLVGLGLLGAHLEMLLLHSIYFPGVPLILTRVL